MCGISGIVNHDRHHPVSEGVLRAMTDVMAHRGPDGRGTYARGAVGLGHRRLSIIDLGGGAQPMSNEDGTCWVTFNGEIYNFQAVRSELVRLGHCFKSSSDTEVIVHAYEEWREGAVGRLQGMFAFAVWDERRHLLLVARDRVGIKPLYYADTGSAFVFASELKAVLTHPDVSRALDPRAIDRFLTYYYVPGDITLFAGISKLEPGHYLVVQDGIVRAEQYWDLEATASSTMTFNEAVEALQGILRRTVRSHMISDVPVGVLLSGGVDSTGVLRFAAEASSKPLHSFTVGFAGEGFADERPFARLAAERYGTRHQELTVDAGAFLNFLPAYAWHMEEPVCEPPAIALYYVSKLARDTGVKVLLSGEGGDEAFAGYQTYRNLLWLERLKSWAGPARPGLRGLLSLAGLLGSSRIGSYAALIDPALEDYYFSRTATPNTLFNRTRAALYRPEFAARVAGSPARDVTRALMQRAGDRSQLDRMLYVDSKTWLPDDLLVKADKMTMATSVELRVPLLDAEVLEFATTLPRSFKLRGGNGKRVLKAALRGSVPSEILNRPKTGFPVPYSRWLRHEGKELLRDAVGSPTAALTQFFEPAAVRGLLDRFIHRGEASKEIFSLLVLELWLQRFPSIQAEPAAAAMAGSAVGPVAHT